MPIRHLRIIEATSHLPILKGLRRATQGYPPKALRAKDQLATRKTQAHFLPLNTDCPAVSMTVGQIFSAANRGQTETNEAC